MIQKRTQIWFDTSQALEDESFLLKCEGDYYKYGFAAQEKGQGSNVNGGGSPRVVTGAAGEQKSV